MGRLVNRTDVCVCVRMSMCVSVQLILNIGKYKENLLSPGNLFPISTK